MERQSSMASSTEEMSASGGNDLSGGSGARGVDAAAAAADHFGVFRDFDFLEYESESVEGESTDNFNWGVRRRPLSDGEPDQPSVRQHEESISEKTPVLTKRKRNAPEESSDDEVGSESPLDEMVVAPEFEANCSVSGQDASTAVYPPSSLSLRSGNGEHTHHHRHHRDRRDSSTRSDTSGSSAGDLGDVTPCNTSPNISSLLTTFRPIVRNDTEEVWRQQVQSGFSQASAHGSTLQLFQHLHDLIKDIGGKAVSMTRDSCQLLSQCSASSAQITQLCARLSATADLVYDRAVQPAHIICFPSTAIGGARIADSLRYGILEMQEHLETFFDRKDHANECIDAVKAALKLQLLGEQQTDIISEELLLDLGRALYKLHFQLLLFVESANKMTSTLTTTLKTSQLNDVTKDILSIRSSLQRISLDDTLTETSESGGGATPTPPPSLSSDDIEAGLFELLQTERWGAALSLVKHNRGCWGLEMSVGDGDDDVFTALNVYSKKLVHQKSDSYVITHTESDLADVFARLFQVSAAVADLEGSMKDRDQHTSDMSTVGQNKD